MLHSVCVGFVVPHVGLHVDIQMNNSWVLGYLRQGNLILVFQPDGVDSSYAS